MSRGGLNGGGALTGGKAEKGCCTTIDAVFGSEILGGTVVACTGGGLKDAGRLAEKGFQIPVGGNQLPGGASITS